MSIYRRKFKSKDRHGNPIEKRAKTYTAETTFGGKLYRRGGFVDRETARHWIDSTRLRLGRGEVAMMKPLVAASVRPLIDQFVAHLDAMKRDDKYVYNTGQRLHRLAKE